MGCHFLLQCMKVKSESEVAQSCPTLSDPMDWSLRGSSVHGIFQTRVLEWGAIAFSATALGSSNFTQHKPKPLPPPLSCPAHLPLMPLPPPSYPSILWCSLCSHLPQQAKKPTIYFMHVPGDPLSVLDSSCICTVGWMI